MFRNALERKLFALGFVYSMFAALLLLLLNGDVFTAPDSYPHIYIPAAVLKNGDNSLVANLGTVWLPLYHVLLLPFILLKPLYSTGLAGTIINGAATGGILVYLARIVIHVTGRKDILYGSIVLFLSHGYTAIYAATPMTEQLTIFLGLAGVYYFVLYWEQDHLPYFVSASAFFALATLTRYEFWLVAAAIVIAMGSKELYYGRSYNLAFFHLPLWGGLLWIIWNIAIFGDPFRFIASETMAVSVGLIPPLQARVLFLVILPIVGGGVFLLPFLLDRSRRMLAFVPAIIFGMYIISYIFEYVGVVSNMRFGYLLFGMLLPSLVVLRRVNNRKTLIILAILILSTMASSGFALSGGYANIIGPYGEVQETGDYRIELPDGVILLPQGQQGYDMSNYPNSYLDPYDGEDWIEASETPWTADVDYVLIPNLEVDRDGRDRTEEEVEEIANLYRVSGPNDGFVWNFHMNDEWRETFLQDFELVNSDSANMLYEKVNSSTDRSINESSAQDSHHGSENDTETAIGQPINADTNNNADDANDANMTDEDNKTEDDDDDSGIEIHEPIND